MTISHEILILGGGIFGVTAALELRARGHDVAVLDQGPIPHPDASSTDISKVVRMEYGSDKQYMALVDEAITGWHAWNERYGEVLYHETGVTMFARRPMTQGGFEYESYRNLLERGHKPERLDSAAIAERYPAWNAAAYVDGFFHARGGFCESGRTVRTLAQDARRLGVSFYENEPGAGLVREGVHLPDGRSIAAGHVVVCAGAWTPLLVPELRSAMRATGHPVFHLKPERPELFTPPRFTTFTADVSRSGWYGFPLHPQEGVVKVANHGVGVPLDPARDARVVTEEDYAALRDFLRGTFPALARADVVFTRRCLYCDTLDGHLWIGRHPDIAGLTVAAGGSGHAMKMAPMLGPMIADAVEGRDNPWLGRFRWRELDSNAVVEEEARFQA